MAIHLILYFNWVLAGLGYFLIPRHRRTIMGWSLIAAAAIIQLAAFGLHWYEWNRLRGQPDALYVWIVPTLLASLAFIAIIVAFVLAALRRNTQGS